MADIFISYASEDRNKAEELAETLSARGWSIWWDRKIPLGKSYDEVIEKALGESKCAIVFGPLCRWPPSGSETKHQKQNGVES